MTLLFPTALALLAALAPVVVAFYLRRVRRRAATVSTLLFWERVLAEQPRRSFLGRLRRVLSLLLQLLLLALLGLALARPEVTGMFTRGNGGVGGLATVLIVDARASMQAREADGRTRFERATEAARAYARRAGPRQAVAVLAVAGPVPRLLAPLAEDDRPALLGLDRLRPTDAGGALEPALDLAGSLLAARPAGEERRVVLFTDHAANGTAGPPGVTVETVPSADPATPRENVGVGRFGVRARPDSPQTFAASGEVFNAGVRRQRGEAELSLDGRLLDVRPFDLPPGGRLALSFPALATNSGLANARGWLRLRLRRPPGADQDALLADDEARAVLPPARPWRVLLVSRGNWFLENMLRADAGVTFDLLDPGAFRPEAAGGFDAVLLDDVPAAQPEKLPAAGNFLFLRQTPFDVPGAPPLLRPLVAEADPASPLLRLTDFRAVTVARAGALPPVDPASASLPGPGGWQLTAPVRAVEGDHPLVLAGERRGADGRTQRLVALPFGLTEGDLPLRVAFPLFIANTVRWLAGADRQAAVPAVLAAGETLALADGETLWTRPQSEVHPAPDRIPDGERVEGPGTFQPLDVGFYLLRRGPAAGGDRWLAVNVENSALATLNLPPGAVPASPASVAAPGAARGWVAEWFRSRPPWVALALAAFVLSSVEWGLFHRRRTE